MTSFNQQCQQGVGAGGAHSCPSLLCVAQCCAHTCVHVSASPHAASAVNDNSWGLLGTCGLQHQMLLGRLFKSVELLSFCAFWSRLHTLADSQLLERVLCKWIWVSLPGAPCPLCSWTASSDARPPAPGTVTSHGVSGEVIIVVHIPKYR